MRNEVSGGQLSQGLRIVILSAAISVLTGCEPEFPVPNSRDFDVREVNRVHVVAFAPMAERPTAEETASLEAFLRSQNLRSAKAVVLEGGFPRTDARRGAVSKILGELGWPDPIFSETEGVTGHIRVIVKHEVYDAEACRRETSLPSNWLPLGCANDYNLSRQIARPGDLLEGQPPKAGPASRAVDAYRRYMGETAPVDPAPEEGETTN